MLQSLKEATRALGDFCDVVAKNDAFTSANELKQATEQILEHLNAQWVNKDEEAKPKETVVKETEEEAHEDETPATPPQQSEQQPPVSGQQPPGPSDASQLSLAAMLRGHRIKEGSKHAD